jgi:hypothetical protein
MENWANYIKSGGIDLSHGVYMNNLMSMASELYREACPNCGQKNGLPPNTHGLNLYLHEKADAPKASTSKGKNKNG